MNIEEALILDQKFVERIRNKYGPLGTEQIKGIIQEAIGHLAGTVFVDNGDAPVGVLLDDYWVVCEACSKIDKPEFMHFNDEEGTHLCDACVSVPDQVPQG